MDLGFNKAPATIMHIDLNSCFATIEQQANPLLRGKPVVVATYNSPGGVILSPSIEAKRLGIKVGFNVFEARKVCPKIVVLTPDPPKYRDVHLKFKKLFFEYSPNVVPKSIDEAVIDFTGTQSLKRGLVTVAKEIKQRMRQEIGEWISCNVGISTNRFLAKLAASLHKPDGLDIITHENLEAVLKTVELTDLCGINKRLELRLNATGIFKPIEFLNASLFLIWKQTFKSINGYYWYLRLRGFEVDTAESSRKTFGQSYALGQKTSDPKELAKIVLKLTEKMGRRLRHAELLARAVHVAVNYEDYTFWHMGKTFDMDLFTTEELYLKILSLFNLRDKNKKVSKIAISCFNLVPTSPSQLNLFDSNLIKKRRASISVDNINDRYGEFVLVPATMMKMDKVVVDRVAFGGVGELEDLYNSKDNLLY